MTNTDPVNPQHYKQGAIECIDALESALTPEEFAGFLKGQVIKYTWRCGRKDDIATEMKKAQWYAERLVLLHSKTKINEGLEGFIKLT